MSRGVADIGHSAGARRASREVALEPLPASRLFDGFRDLGVRVEPALSPPLACDPSFNRYSAYWLLGPTLDSTFPALEALAQVSPPAARTSIERFRASILRFLGDHFDRDRQRFSTNSSPRTKGVFATLSAINVMKSLCGLEPGKPLTEKRFREVMTDACGEEAAEEALTGIDDLIADCRSSDGEGLIENPAKPLIPSLTALSTAASVLWNLWPGEEQRHLVRYLPAATLERFVAGCIQRGEENGASMAGFSIHPDIDQRCVNTTFFGLRLMKRLGMELDPADDVAIELFLSCSYREGGFSSTLGEPRSLNATLFGLRALALLESPLARSLRRGSERLRVRDFVLSCRPPGSDGFAFSPDFTRYRENSLASRYAVQILQRIGVAPPSGTSRFFLRQFDDDTGGFAAYPPSAVATAGLDARKVERYLLRKDRRLLESFPGRSDDSAGREWRRIQALYDRLADLEVARDTGESARDDEAEALWSELRSLQRERAKRYETYFDETVLGPLRDSRRMIEEARQSLSG